PISFQVCRGRDFRESGTLLIMALMAKRKRRTPPDEAFARVVSEELQIYRDALADISPAIQAELNHLLGGRGDWPTHEGAPDIEVLVDILMELYSYAQTDDR